VDTGVIVRRRRHLGSAGGGACAVCQDSTAVARPRQILDLLKRGRTFGYGPHRSQRAELHLPPGAGAHPVIVLIHGGSWRARYGRAVMRGLAGDLVTRGWAVWNIEYRRVGGGGGWPATFADVVAAIDHLRELHEPLALDAITIIGHSAGGHLALWAAGRDKLPEGAPGFIAGAPAVAVARVVAQAGVCDLAGAYRRSRGGGAPRALMGGSPEEFPERYAVGDPMCLLPLSMPALLVHGTLDETVSIKLARNYERASRAAEGQVELVEIPGEAGRHRAHIDPRGAAWAAVTSRLPVAGSQAGRDRLGPRLPSATRR
jgi:acetyl esterase/lipase